jgi:hypothetical protein
MTYLSFLMRADNIRDEQLEALGVRIMEKDEDGDRKLEIPRESLQKYIELIRYGLNPGFWNEVVGEEKIIFVFKFKEGTIQEYRLGPENEKEIAALCSQLNGDPLEKTANVYKYLSGNSFYKDFMMEHYDGLMHR